MEVNIPGQHAATGIFNAAVPAQFETPHTISNSCFSALNPFCS